MKMKRMKNLLSLTLALLMVMTCTAPVTALAASEKKATVSGVKYTYTVTKGKATVTSVDFGENYSKKSFTFPTKLGGKTVTAIKYSKRMVTGGYTITSVTIPKTVTAINMAPLADEGHNVKKYAVAKGSKNFTASSSVLFTKDKKTLVAYPASKSGKSYSVPKNVKKIGQYAFYHCANLKSVSLPKSLTTLSTAAFKECTNLSSIDMSKTKIKTVPNECFMTVDYGTGSLTKVKFAPTTASIGDSAFLFQMKLKSVTFPASIKSVKQRAFNGTSLSTATVPKKVKSVSFGDGAFATSNGGVTLVVKDKNTSISCHKNSCVRTIKAPKNSKAAKYAKAHKKDGISYKELK